MANRDGLEPGQEVDFETMQRVNRARTQRARQPTESKPAPKRSTPARSTEE